MSGGGVNTRPVPVTLLDWPRVRDMISQQKFILMYLWPNIYQTACGCYMLPIEPAAASMSMTASSLIDALDEFERRRLVEIDKITGEIWICDWFRFYQPTSARAHWAVKTALEKIASQVLREKVGNAYKSMVVATKEKEKEKEKEKKHAPADRASQSHTEKNANAAKAEAELTEKGKALAEAAFAAFSKKAKKNVDVDAQPSAQATGPRLRAREFCSSVYVKSKKASSEGV